MSSVLTQDDCKHFKRLNNVLHRSKQYRASPCSKQLIFCLCYIFQRSILSQSLSLNKNPSLFLEFCSFKFFPFLLRFTTSSSSHQSDTASHFLAPSSPTICYFPQDLGDARGKRQQQQQQLKPAQRKWGFSSHNGVVLAFTDHRIQCGVSRQDSGSSQDPLSESRVQTLATKQANWDWPPQTPTLPGTPAESLVLDSSKRNVQSQVALNQDGQGMM